MRRFALSDMWRGGSERAIQPRPRMFGATRATVGQRLSGVLSPESLFRLILAFVLATALWLYVTSKAAPEAETPYPNPIPISYINLGPDLTLRNSLPDVRATVGAASLLASANLISASVNLQGLGAGDYKHVPVQLAHPGIAVLSHTPHTVEVILERIVTKVVPVRLLILGSPASGYAAKAGGITPSPSVVKLVGAATLVDQITQAVVPISLSNSRASFDESFAPILENGQGKALHSQVSVSPITVRVQAVIVQQASFKTLPILASIRGEPAEGFGVTSIQVTPPGLTAYGGAKTLNNVQHLETDTVSVSGLRAGMKTLTVRLRVPARVRFHRRLVRVTITVGPVIGAAVTRVAVRPTGLAAGEVATIHPGTVLVTVTGPAPRLRSAGRRIQVLANLAGLATGTYEIQPTITAPKGLRVDVVEPTTISVTISPG